MVLLIIIRMLITKNPYWAIGTNRNIDETSRFVGNFNLSYDINESSISLLVQIAWGNGKNWRAAQTYNSDLQPAAGAISSFVEDSNPEFYLYTMHY
jgi:hypothetical protein